jgi:hypothetical protein
MRSWKLQSLFIAVPNDRFEVIEPYLQEILPHVAIGDLNMIPLPHGQIIY